MTEKLNPGQCEIRTAELAGTHTRQPLICSHTVEFLSNDGKETILFHWDGGDGHTEEIIKNHARPAKKTKG